MWVKFVSKTSEGTLFNFGNPLNTEEELSNNAYGFRLDTKVNKYNDKYYRYIRLIVRDWHDGLNYKLRDNHFGTTGLTRFSQRSVGWAANTVYGAHGFYDDYNNTVYEDTGRPRSYYPNIHEAFPQIPTDNLDEWYFICATFNSNITEIGYDESQNYGSLGDVRQNTQFWLNHVNEDGPIDDSGLGAKCKVEIISRSDLLNARGYLGRPLTVTSILEEELEPQQQEEETTPTGNPPTADFTYVASIFGNTGGE